MLSVSRYCDGGADGDVSVDDEDDTNKYNDDDDGQLPPGSNHKDRNDVIKNTLLRARASSCRSHRIYLRSN